MAAVHFSKHVQCELHHIYDSSTPAIGVGEGTTPSFPDWLTEVTGLSFAQLQKRLYITKKFGIHFENWGQTHSRFFHRFLPFGRYAYHISAENLSGLLREHINSTHLDRRVTSVKNDGTKARITFEEGDSMSFDFVVDARGFPKESPDDVIHLPWLTTSAALIRKGPPVPFRRATRSIARHFGWVFVIPLLTHTSYGYVFNEDLNIASDVGMDFSKLLDDEGVVSDGGERLIRFPSFVRKTMFDRRVFYIGNAASFLEPLQATAISIILIQIEAAKFLIQTRQVMLESEQSLDQIQQTLSEQIQKHVIRISMFVGWHYSMGSRFDSEFWLNAVNTFRSATNRAEWKFLRSEFDIHRDASRNISESELGLAPEPFDLGVFPGPVNVMPQAFGSFLETSFASIGYGTGVFGGIEQNTDAVR